MKYELAKRLKDAGFPQDGEGEWLHTPDCKGWDAPSDCTEKTRAYVPILSELIEACGEYFCLVMRRSDTNWGAEGVDSDKYSANGSTPEEAVAELWLALNEKKV